MRFSASAIPFDLLDTNTKLMIYQSIFEFIEQCSGRLKDMKQS